MKAVWNGAVVAKSDQTIQIEGNEYFPPSSVDQANLVKSEYQTTCPWKGLASYYHVVVDGETNENAAWYYPQPKDGSIERVGLDFTNYVAFWNGVEVN